MGLFRKKSVPPIRSPHITDQNNGYDFRRSRTLTGSTAPTIQVANESRAQLKSPRLKEHELRSHRRRLGTYLLGALIVIGLLSALLSQFVGIVDIRLSSQSPLQKQPQSANYQKVINDYFAQWPFERFRFALNQTQFTAYVESKVPEIQSISFRSKGLASATADLVLRQPIVAWQLGQSRYYVDGDGHSFSQNYFTEPSITVKDDSGIDPAAGAIVSDRFLRFMGRVIMLTNASGQATVSGVTIPPNTSREIDLSFSGRSYVVKTLLDRDPAGQATDIINALRYIDSKGIKPQYVDVRISSKAIYRN